jgi:hypothetical protein
VAEEGYELDSKDHSNIMTMSPSRKLAVSPARDYLLYNLYWDVEGQNFTLLGHNAPFAIRDSQYKLMHTYVGNKQDQWYPTNDTVRSDDDFTTEASCSQDGALTGTFTKMLFDLVNDPYEETNLYNEDGYDDIKVGPLLSCCCVDLIRFFLSESSNGSRLFELRQARDLVHEHVHCYEGVEAQRLLHPALELHQVHGALESCPGHGHHPWPM